MIFSLYLLFYSLNMTQGSSELSEINALTISGSRMPLNRLVGEQGLVLLARESGCPISEKLGPRLKKMETKFSSLGFSFVYLYVGQINSIQNAIADKTKYGFGGAYLTDPKLEVAKSLGLKTTTEAVVFNKHGKILYRGAVDDQFEIGVQKYQASNDFLEQKLQEIAGGKIQRYSETTAHGCIIAYPKKEEANIATINYEEHISPIFQRKCLPCHTSQTGVMDLSTYDSVKARAKTIKYVIEKNIMPPWNVKTGGPWLDDFSLTDAEKKLILPWLKSVPKQSGMLQPSPTVAYDSWSVGEPSKVIKIPRPVKILADGPMEYQHFIIENPFTEDVWIRGFEFKTLPKVVHHAVVHVLKDSYELRPEKFPVNFISRFGWAPGARAQFFPPNVGALIPKKSKLALTLHYAANGEATIDDKTRIGLYTFSKKPLHVREEWTLLDEKVMIPPHAVNFVNRIEKSIPYDAYVMAMNTHMHLRGKRSRILLETSKDKTETLFEVDPYLFEFQFTYERRNVFLVKKGQKIICENTFDNSSSNKSNPDPNRAVAWGEDTTDEMSMCNLFVYPAKGADDPARKIKLQ